MKQDNKKATRMDRGWSKMQPVLEKELPQKKADKNMLLWWTSLGILFTGLAITFLYINSSESTISHPLVEQNHKTPTIANDNQVSNKNEGLITESTSEATNEVAFQQQTLKNKPYINNPKSIVTGVESQTNPTAKKISPSPARQQEQSRVSPHLVRVGNTTTIISNRQIIKKIKNESQISRLKLLEQEDNLIDELLANKSIKKNKRLQSVQLIPNNEKLATNLSSTSASHSLILPLQVVNLPAPNLSKSRTKNIRSGFSLSPRVGYSRSQSSITLGLATNYSWHICDKLSIGLQAGAEYIPANYYSRGDVLAAGTQEMLDETNITDPPTNNTSIGLGLDTMITVGVPGGIFDNDSRLQNEAFNEFNLNTSLFSGLAVSCAFTEKLSVNVNGGFEIYPFKNDNIEIAYDSDSFAGSQKLLLVSPSKNFYKYLELDLNYQLTKNTGLFVGHHFTENFQLSNSANLNPNRFYAGLRLHI